MNDIIKVADLSLASALTINGNSEEAVNFDVSSQISDDYAFGGMRTYSLGQGMMIRRVAWTYATKTITLSFRNVTSSPITIPTNIDLTATFILAPKVNT